MVGSSYAWSDMCQPSSCTAALAQCLAVRTLTHTKERAGQGGGARAGAPASRSLGPRHPGPLPPASAPSDPAASWPSRAPAAAAGHTRCNTGSAAITPILRGRKRLHLSNSQGPAAAAPITGFSVRQSRIALLLAAPAPCAQAAFPDTAVAGVCRMKRRTMKTRKMQLAQTSIRRRIRARLWSTLWLSLRMASPPLLGCASSIRLSRSLPRCCVTEPSSPATRS